MCSIMLLWAPLASFDTWAMVTKLENYFSSNCLKKFLWSITPIAFYFLFLTWGPGRSSFQLGILANSFISIYVPFIFGDIQSIWEKLWWSPRSQCSPFFFFLTQGAFNTEGKALHYCSPIQKRIRIVLNY